MARDLPPQAAFDAAYEYLLEFDTVTDSLLATYLTLWEDQRAESLPALYRGFLKAAYNRQGMRHSIGDLDALESLLYGFSPGSIDEAYESWEEFFLAVEQSTEVSPPGRMEKDNPRNYWVQYSKSVVSGAPFFAQFDDIDAYSEFVADFYANTHTRYALPLLLSERIHGLGFALACDFLKENGYPKFAKPDVHVKDLFQGLGLTDGTSDYEVFVDVVRFADEIDREPYEVDKLFWLVGSGRFYREDPELRVSTDKQEFIERVSIVD